jgi:hypothetical protein
MIGTGYRHPMIGTGYRHPMIGTGRHLPTTGKALRRSCENRRPGLSGHLRDRAATTTRNPSRIGGVAPHPSCSGPGAGSVSAWVTASFVP